MNRFVFLNQNATSINNLVVDLSLNSLSHLPRFYGNVSQIAQLWMVAQTNGSLSRLNDHFFDNSYPFRMGNTVLGNKFIIENRACSLDSII